MQKHVDPATWLEAMAKARALIAKDDLIRIFRMARALAFLLRVSPTAEGRILKLIADSLTDARAQRVIAVALFADDLLESQDCATRIDVSPNLILQLLKLVPCPRG